MADFVIFVQTRLYATRPLTIIKSFLLAQSPFFWGVVVRRTLVLLGCIQTYKKITIFYIFFNISYTLCLEKQKY